MRPTTLVLFALVALAATGCPSGGDDDPNPDKLWLKATEIVGTIELVAEEPEPY
jgi:hypothetical protein